MDVEHARCPRDHGLASEKPKVHVLVVDGKLYLNCSFHGRVGTVEFDRVSE